MTPTAAAPEKALKLSQVEPSEDELRVLLEAAFVLREAGRFDDAAAVCRGVYELTPDSEVALVALGSVELQRGNFDQAVAVYEDALRKHPESLYARVQRAEALLFQRRREEAEAELNAIIDLGASSPHSRTARALLDAADLICGRPGD